MSNQSSPGDTNNVLLRKILTEITASVSDGILEANRPRPGDTDNNLLRKILTLLGSGTIAAGEAAPVLAAPGPPTTVSGVTGDVYIDLDNGNVYIFEGDTWVLQTSTIGNTWSAGVGFPSDDFGRDGDYFLSTDTGLLALKAGGTWSFTGVRFEFFQEVTTLGYAGTVTLDFALSGYQTLALTGDVIFNTANRAAGKAKAIRITADGTPRNFTFPLTWVWVGSAAPASIAANKTAVLSITNFGNTDANIVAVYAVQV